MRIPPQSSAASIVALGHFNPLIFRPDWLKEKEIVVGNDFENLKTSIVHPEIVSYQIPWGTFKLTETCSRSLQRGNHSCEYTTFLFDAFNVYRRHPSAQLVSIGKSIFLPEMQQLPIALVTF